MSRKLVMVAVITELLMFQACTLFNPRDTFEEPDDKNIIDMQWIGNILECPQNTLDKEIKFNDYHVTELFAVDFKYTDVNDPAGTDCKKEYFVNRINSLGTPESVEWENVGTCTYRGPDTIMIRDTKYAIVFAGNIKISGRSDFNIVKQDKYRIIKWINYPAGSSISYLTPIEE